MMFGHESPNTTFSGATFLMNPTAGLSLISWLSPFALADTFKSINSVYDQGLKDPTTSFVAKPQGVESSAHISQTQGPHWLNRCQLKK